MYETNAKIEQVKTLKTGKGIQNLLNASYEILGNPIAMFNTEFKLQAYTNVISDDPCWNELITYGTFSYETQVLFAEEGFIDAVANTMTTAVLVSDKLKYDRILGKLYNEENIQVSNLILIASSRPLEDDDEAVLEAVCKVFSREISKSEFYKTYGKLYQETYIRKLIDGELVEKELYAAHLAIVFNSFKSGMRLIVADIGKCDPEYSKIAYFRDYFRSIQGNFEYSIYSSYILIIINSIELKFNPKRDLKKLYMTFKENNISIGVSSNFDNMFKLREYYDEAVKALTHGLSCDDGENIHLYDKLEHYMQE